MQWAVIGKYVAVLQAEVLLGTEESKRGNYLWRSWYRQASASLRTRTQKSRHSGSYPGSCWRCSDCKGRDPSSQNGGTILLKCSWAMSQLRRMGYVKWRGSTSVSNEAIKHLLPCSDEGDPTSQGAPSFSARNWLYLHYLSLSSRGHSIRLTLATELLWNSCIGLPSSVVSDSCVTSRRKWRLGLAEVLDECLTGAYT